MKTAYLILAKTPAMFARKFNLNTDRQIIDAVLQSICR
jgi:hypothetical protein